MSRPNPQISIVIPLGPNETAWPRLVGLLDRELPEAEIVLSAAAPPDPARSAGRARWIHGPAGRARQLNHGATAARGPMLWLLHADCRPAPASVAAARRFAAAGEHDRLGWFDLAFDRDGPALTRLNAAGANLRSRLLKLPFGDQGWMLTAETFSRLGGFDPGFGRGEDLEFVVRARHHGVRLQRLGAPLLASARRYRDSGWLATTLAHLALTLKFRRKARIRLKDASR